jgi:predicted flavoprotein YhiN
MSAYNRLKEKWQKTEEELNTTAGVSMPPDVLADKERRKKMNYDGRTKDGKAFFERMMRRRAMKEWKKASVTEARSVTEKLAKKNQDIIDLIKQQINLDLNPYIVDSFSNNKMVTIEIDELSQTNLANIERIANQFKSFSIQPNGAKKIALIPVSSKYPYKRFSISGV